MKRFSKVLAIVLALVLAVGVVPASAATGDLSLTKTKKTIFADGCKGTTAEGKIAKYYDYAGIKKLVKNFKSKTMDIKLESSDTSVASTDNKKDRVNAVAPGKATVTVSVYNKKTSELLFEGKVAVTVKKNATTSTLLINGIKDGQAFKVNDTAKVTLTRKSGTDTDLRRLTCSSDDVTITEAGTRKYKVTFKKEGTYTLTAESYMSAKYSGATASKSISVTVAAGKKEEEKKEEEKKEEKKKLEIVQLATDKFKVTGSAITDTYSESSVKIHTIMADTEIPYYSNVKEFSVADNTATVRMMSDFIPGETYYITVGEEKASFKAVTVDSLDPLKSVKSIVINTHEAYINEMVPIEVVYLNENGVDITNLVSTYASGRVTFTDMGNGSNCTIMDGTINIYEKGKVVSVKAEMITGYNQVTSEEIKVTTTGNIVGKERPVPQVAATKWTISLDGDTIYYKEKDAQNTTVCVGDTNAVLEVLFRYSDGTVKNISDMGVVVSSLNENVLMIGSGAPSGGLYLIPNQVGTAYVEFKVGDKKVSGISITVQAKREARNIVISLDKNKLNINGALNDTLEITATVKDQYSQDMKDQFLTISQKEASLRDVAASFSGYNNGKFIVDGSTTTKYGTAAEYTVVADITNGNGLTRSVNFQVSDIPYDPAKIATYTTSLEIEGDSVIDTGLINGTQNDKETYVYAKISSNGYSLYEIRGRLLDKAPTTTMKAADFGVAPGTPIVAMTIRFRPESGAETYITSGVNIDTASDNVLVFDPVNTGTKLAKGTYTINAYILTPGDTSTTVTRSINPTRVITVKDNSLSGTYKQKAEKLNVGGSVESVISQFFDFYVEGTKLDPSAVSSVEYNANMDGKSAYIVSVTVTLTNDPYGPFTVKIPVGQLIKFTV